MILSLRWRHNGCDSVSNHQPHDCLLNRLLRRRSKKTSKLRVTGLCAENSSGTGEFPAQMGSNAENVSIWWRHHVAKKPQQRLDATWPTTKTQSVQKHSVTFLSYKNSSTRQLLLSNFVLYKIPDSKVHGAKMGPTWVLSAPDGSHVTPWTLLSGMVHGE